MTSTQQKKKKIGNSEHPEMLILRAYYIILNIWQPYSLQPHADVSTITARLNALQYLVDNPDLFYTLQVRFRSVFAPVDVTWMCICK